MIRPRARVAHEIRLSGRRRPTRANSCGRNRQASKYELFRRNRGIAFRVIYKSRNQDAYTSRSLLAPVAALGFEKRFELGADVAQRFGNHILVVGIGIENYQRGAKRDLRAGIKR